jgi:hypothetical protein
MRLFLILIPTLMFSTVACEESVNPTGGGSKKAKPKTTNTEQDKTSADMNDADNANAGDIQFSEEESEVPNSNVLQPEEYAEEPTNVLGTFLVNKLPAEEGGKTVKLGLTVVDSNGNKVSHTFEFGAKFRSVHRVTTQLLGLPYERTYHAIQFIRAESSAEAEAAANDIFLSASGELDGDTLTSTTSVIDDEVRDGDTGEGDIWEPVSPN